MPVNIVIQTDEPNIVKIEHVMNRIAEKMMKPDPTKAVKQVATVWGLNYRAEGSQVGGWVALAQSTVRDRERQGFRGDHPILIRGGSLYAMSTLFFMDAQPGRATSHSSYDGRSIATTATLNIVDGTATLGLSGPKTVHQKGNWTPPRRPFWFTDRNVILAARLGVIEWINQEVIDLWK